MCIPGKLMVTAGRTIPISGLRIHWAPVEVAPLHCSMCSTFGVRIWRAALPAGGVLGKLQVPTSRAQPVSWLHMQAVAILICRIRIGCAASLALHIPSELQVAATWAEPITRLVCHTDACCEGCHVPLWIWVGSSTTSACLVFGELVVSATGAKPVTRFPMSSHVRRTTTGNMRYTG